MPDKFDTTDFPEDLGFKFDPITGEAFMGFTTYSVSGDPVTEYKPTGYTYHVDNWEDGPGVHQKAGIVAFATKETADKVVSFLLNSIDSTLKCEVADTEWDVFKIVDSAGNKVPQYQLAIKDSNGNEKSKLNAGLTASTIIRAQNNDFAAQIVKAMLS